MMDIILRNINILRNFISFKFITFNKNQAKLIIFNDYLIRSINWQNKQITRQQKQIIKKEKTQKNYHLIIFN